MTRRTFVSPLRALPALLVLAAIAGCNAQGKPPSTVAAATDTPATTPVSTCGADWLAAPPVDASLAIPDANRTVVLHTAAQGTQDYVCKVSGKSIAWTFTGPEATLQDCRGGSAGRHYGSPAGPVWEAPDGAKVIGRKVAAWSPPLGGAVPWLLLEVKDRQGTGALAQVTHVQRVNTEGGVAPATGCDAHHLGAVEKVAYKADYYFFGPAR